MIHCQPKRAHFHFTKNWLYCSLFYFTTNEDTKQADEMPGYPLNRVTGHHSCSSTSNREKKKEWGKAGRKREEKKKKSLVDPEIIAHAMTYQECGSSGGQIVVYSLSEGPQRERHKRGKRAAIGLRSRGTRVSCGRTWHKACPNREHTHTQLESGWGILCMSSTQPPTAWVCWPKYKKKNDCALTCCI